MDCHTEVVPNQSTFIWEHKLFPSCLNWFRLRGQLQSSTEEFLLLCTRRDIQKSSFIVKHSGYQVVVKSWIECTKVVVQKPGFLWNSKIRGSHNIFSLFRSKALQKVKKIKNSCTFRVGESSSKFQSFFGKYVSILLYSIQLNTRSQVISTWREKA